MFKFDEAFFSNFFITIINLLVLFFILKKLLFKPVTNFIDNRNGKIEEAINSANSLKEEVENMKQEYEDKLKGAGEEGKKIVEEYRDRASVEYTSAIDTAKREIDVEKDKAIAELKQEVGNLVVTASEKVIKKNMDTETNRKLISEFIDSGVA